MVGGGGLFKRGACLILWPMVGNFFGDHAAGVLHIQMKYKYKKMIFFFLILEMVTFAKLPIKCVWNNPWGVNRLLITFNASLIFSFVTYIKFLSSSVHNSGWYNQVHHRPITHFTLMYWFACLLSHYYHHWSGCLIQEKHLFDIMAHEVGTFLGEAADVLQIQMEKWFFLFLILDTVTFAEPTNQMPCYSTCMSWRGMGILTLTCVWLAVPSTSQCNSTSSKAIIIYYYILLEELFFVLIHCPWFHY